MKDATKRKIQEHAADILEIKEIVADAYAQMFNTLIHKGFTREEALQLVMSIEFTP